MRTPAAGERAAGLAPQVALIRPPYASRGRTIVTFLLEAQGQVTQTVLVTGSSGFVGRRLVTALAGAGYRVLAASRNPSSAGVPDGVQVVRLPNLAERINWDSLLAEVAYVVHLAGVAHQGAAASEEMYDRINHVAVADLAAAAAKAGLARLIFISSIGSQSGPSSDHLLTEADDPRPTTGYGRSKLAGEQVLAEYARDFDVITIRCPTSNALI